MRLIITSFIFSIIFSSVNAQGSSPFKRTHKKFLDTRTTDLRHLGQGGITPTPFKTQLSDIDIISDREFFLSSLLKKRSSFGLINSTIRPDSNFENIGSSATFQSDVIYLDSIISYADLSITGINTSTLDITRSHLRNIIGQRFGGALNVVKVTVDNLWITNSNLKLDLNSITSSKEKFLVEITDSKIRRFVCGTLARKNIFRFVRDTIMDFQVSSINSRVTSLYFNNCYIDGNFYFDSQLYDSTSLICTFMNCSFGPNASLNFYGGTVTSVFSGCNKFAKPLSVYSSMPRARIFCQNSQIENIDFDYVGDFYLANDTTVDNDNLPAPIIVFSEENILSNYERLLSKYKTEKKSLSAKNIDLEYIRYKASKGNFIDRCLYIADNVYWLHGYKKLRVFLWTIGFVLIFWVFNLITVKKFGMIYPVTHVNWHDQFQTRKPKRYKFFRSIRTLLFTAVLFFSFHLNFDKLKQQTNGYMAWILFQYIVGVLSLFFIFNAVVKL